MAGGKKHRLPPEVEGWICLWRERLGATMCTAFVHAIHSSGNTCDVGMCGEVRCPGTPVGHCCCLAVAGALGRPHEVRRVVHRLQEGCSPLWFPAAPHVPRRGPTGQLCDDHYFTHPHAYTHKHPYQTSLVFFNSLFKTCTKYFQSFFKIEEFLLNLKSDGWSKIEIRF